MFKINGLKIMAQIQCTQKLLKELKVKPEEIQPELSSLANWYANLLLIDRRKCVLLTHQSTLYSVFIPGLKKPDFIHFPEVIGQNIFENLLQEDIPQEQLELVLDEFQTISYTKTSNRSVLGSMNDLAFQLNCRVSADGGLNNIDIYEVNHYLNQTPMSAIKDTYPIEALKKLLLS